MLQIRPQETFPIVYVIGDPSDAATYYVRAVIKDSGNNITIQTVNLTDQGNRRFTVNIQAPTDTSGTGRWIDVTVSIYTDSGYTTKSTTYLEDNARYLVHERWSYAFQNAATRIDYKRIEKIVADKEIELPENEPLLDYRPHLETILARLDDVEAIIENLEPTPATDLLPVLDSIQQGHLKLHDAVSNLPKPELDLSPILTKLEALSPALEPLLRDVARTLETIQNSVAEHMPLMQENLTSVKEKIKDFLYLLETKDRKTPSGSVADGRLKMLL